MTFTLSGFNTFKREGIELTGTFTATVNADLRVGQLAETITVTGESPIVDIQNTAQQRVFAILIPGMTGTIVVNSSVIRSLPSVNIVPLDGTRVFLALEPGRGVSDLELAVIDRLDDGVQARERQALEQLRRQLRTWRRDPALRFHSRAIIVVEALAASRATGDSSSARAADRKRDRHRHSRGSGSTPSGPLSSQGGPP